MSTGKYHLSSERIKDILNTVPSIKDKCKTEESQLIAPLDILVSDGITDDHCLELVLSRRTSHVVQNSILGIEDQLSTLQKLLINESQYYDSLFQFIKGEVHAVSFDVETDRDKLLIEIFNICDIDLNLTKNKILLQAGHELLMNSQIDAPRNYLEQNQLDSNTNRNKSLFLIEKNLTDKIIVMTTIDFFGSLVPQKMLQSISTARESNFKIDSTATKTGAGLGSSILYNYCDSIYLGAIKNKMSRVTVVLPLLMAEKNMLGIQKSIHIMGKSDV
jgi:hypothetical protein